LTNPEGLKVTPPSGRRGYPLRNRETVVLRRKPALVSALSTILDVLSTLPVPDLSIFSPVFEFWCLGVPRGGRRAVERIRALAPPSGPILRVERCPPP